MPDRATTESAGRLPRAALLLLALAAVLLLRYAWTRAISIDEIEHLHSTWYVAHGARPYGDFFQHHHPLLWYVATPLLHLCGETVAAVRAARIAAWALTLLVAAATGLLAAQASGSRRAALPAAALLLGAFTFVQMSIEFRPDLLQTLCWLLSLVFWFRHRETGRTLDIVLAGALAGLAFLVLQKALFAWPAYGALALFGLAERKTTWRGLLLFAAAFAAVLLPAAAWLTRQGLWHEYWVTCWLTNMGRTHAFPFSRGFCKGLVPNAVLWLLVAAGFWQAWRRRSTPAPWRQLSVAALLLLAAVLAAGVPHRQYYLPVIPLLCVPAAAWLESCSRGGRWHHCLGTAGLLAAAGPTLVLLARPRDGGDAATRLARIEYVLQQSAPTDAVFDGTCRFNLFRPDIHSLWFGWAANDLLARYSRAGGRHAAGTNVAALLRERQPLFLSDSPVDPRCTGLADLYEATPFPHLYRRRGTHAARPEAP
jgi:hypothetical protein